MPGPRIALDVDDLVRRYVAGESQQSLAKAFGVSTAVIADRLTRAGVTLRKQGEAQIGRYQVHIDIDELVRRYNAGESVKALAQHFGIARNGIQTRLIRAGIQPRDRSAAMYQRMANASPEERARLAEAAHAAVRGRKQSTDFLIARARQNEGRLNSNVSPAEIELARLLRAHGLQVAHQKAVGKYNVDLATGPVAVEILGGSWHRTKRHGERLRHILDAGWDIVYIWVTARTPLAAGAAQYVISHLQFRDRNPAEPRCYRVIRGGGQFVAGGSAQDDDIPDVLPVSDRPDVPPAEVAPGFCHCGCGGRTRLARQNNPRKGWVRGEPVRYISGHNTPRRTDARRSDDAPGV